MDDLMVIVPSRSRPHTVAELAEAMAATCTEPTTFVVAIDDDDPSAADYRQAVTAAASDGARVRWASQPSGTMVSATNTVALAAAECDNPPAAMAFLGDDHRPRTRGWDRAYLDALATLPGITYGDDLVQHSALPTQFAVSTPVVQALGHMAPPVLAHLYVDNYWRDLGQAAGCISYLPHVIVEHLHPVAGTAQWDDGYRRVNAPAMYQRDKQAYLDYMAANRDREVLALRTLQAGAVAGG